MPVVITSTPAIVDVVPTTTPIAVTVTSATVQITAGAGPGPKGDPSGLTMTQPTASTTWTLNHNLGYQPNVQLFTVGGVAMIAEIIHTSNNQTVVTFSVATAGTARLA
jgi:hypothetical protein